TVDEGQELADQAAKGVVDARGVLDVEDEPGRAAGTVELRGKPIENFPGRLPVAIEADTPAHGSRSLPARKSGFKNLGTPARRASAAGPPRGRGLRVAARDLLELALGDGRFPVLEAVEVAQQVGRAPVAEDRLPERELGEDRVEAAAEAGDADAEGDRPPLHVPPPDLLDGGRGEGLAAGEHEVPQDAARVEVGGGGGLAALA